MSSPQRADRDVRELTTFRYRLTLLCHVRLPQGPRLPWPSASFSRKTISSPRSQYSKATCPTVKAGGPVKDLHLRVDVRHTNENDRHFYLRFDTTLAGERSFFCDNRWFFAVGPTGSHLLTNQVAQWFTNTCLLDFAAFSPALACWTCCIFTSF